jgi:hypothetical protein
MSSQENCAVPDWNGLASCESILQKADRNICRLEGSERKKFFEEARNRFPDIYHLTAFNDRGESIEALHARQEQLWGWHDQRPAARKARKQPATKP